MRRLEFRLTYYHARQQMLDRLDDIPWSQLTHAYGSAEDVPDQIRALASTNAKKQEEALWQLYGNIFHQGTRYEASSHAIPFLYELIKEPTTPAKHYLIHLLVSLALGYAEYFLPDGIVPDVLRELDTSDTDPSSQCYQAVRRGVPVLLDLLNDRNDSVRGVAVYALAWFPQDAEQSVGAIENLLSTEQDQFNIANAILSLGLLRRSSGIGFESSRIEAHLNGDSLLLRTAAAIALATEPMEQQVIEILTDAVRRSSEFDEFHSVIPFNEGDLVGYVGRILTQAGGNVRASSIQALSEALKSANPMQSLDITGSLLDLVFKRDNPEQGFDSIGFEALLTIADHGAWEIEGALFANYSALIRAYGLPGSADELREFVRTQTA